MYKKETCRQFLVLSQVYVNTLLMGCTIGWLPNAKYLLTQPNSNIAAGPNEFYWLSVWKEAGKVLFAVPAGMLVDSFGSKYINNVIGILHFVSWLVLSATSSITVTYLTRFTLGLAAALMNASAFATIGEVASPENRGFFIGIYQIFMYLGILLEGVIAVYIENYITLAHCTVILTVLYFATIKMSFDTPNQLIMSSNYPKAMKNLKYIRCCRDSKELENEFDQMKTYICKEKDLLKSTSPFYFFTLKSIRTPLKTAILLNIFHILLGVNVISAYIKIAIPDNAYVPKKFYPLVIIALSLSSMFFTTYFLDKISRRTAYVTCAVIAFTVQLSNAVANYFYTFLGLEYCLWLSLFGNVFMMVFWTGVLVPVNNTVRSEILPQTIKGIGNGICLLFQVTTNVFNYTLYGANTSTAYGNYNLYYMYLFYAACSIFLALIVFFRLPEGRRKYLAEIQNN